MTTPASGAIKLTNLQTEFGGTNPISMSEYYAGGVNVPAGTTGGNGSDGVSAGTVIPSSGTLKMANFYNATKSSTVTGVWLIVGGGGGGQAGSNSNNGGGGGGGGQVVYGSFSADTGTVFTTTVGAGGTNRGNANTGPGGKSALAANNCQITVQGGGAGGANAQNPPTSGSATGPYAGSLGGYGSSTTTNVSVTAPFTSTLTGRSSGSTPGKFVFSDPATLPTRPTNIAGAVRQDTKPSFTITITNAGMVWANGVTGTISLSYTTVSADTYFFPDITITNTSGATWSGASGATSAATALAAAINLSSSTVGTIGFWTATSSVNVVTITGKMSGHPAAVAGNNQGGANTNGWIFVQTNPVTIPGPAAASFSLSGTSYNVNTTVNFGWLGLGGRGSPNNTTGGGGGSGAGAGGGAGTNTVGGTGGAGLQWPTAVGGNGSSYGGGGGGGATSSSFGGGAGVNGGGNGWGTSAGASGTANTGGGGGGGYGGVVTGNGGSGVVILGVLASSSNSFNNASSTVTVGSYRYYIYNSSTTATLA